MSTIWRASNIIEGYEVSNTGEVRNAKTQKTISQVGHKNTQGDKTMHVRVSHLGSRIFVEVSAIVADAFPAPKAPEPTKKDDKLDGIQKIAKRNIQGAYDWVVGGMENSLSDGHISKEVFDAWIAEEAVGEVYQIALNETYDGGCNFGSALKEMRFAGREYCMDQVLACFAADGYKVSAEVPAPVDETVRKSRGPKGVSVMCKETGVIYPSKSAAARANHMDGESVTDSIKYGRPRKGCTFVLVGDNA